jgi:hypothetical protein
MPLAPEVYVLQAEVGGDQRFVPPRKRQHRTVVPDAVAGALSAHGCRVTNSFDQQLFSQGQWASVVNLPAQYTGGHG